MPNYKRIGIIGGDRRLYYIAKQLLEEGRQVIVYALMHQETLRQPEDHKDAGGIIEASSLQEFMEYAQVIIAPIPFSRDGNCIYCENMPKADSKEALDLSIHVFYTFIQPQHIIAGGNIPEAVKKAAEEQNAMIYDFMQLESVAVENAVATAEGTIAEAIKESDGNLDNSSCVIFGYGRCAKALAKRLAGMNAEVTIVARNTGQLQEAYENGYETVQLSDLYEHFSDGKDRLLNADYIFNTVPALIITHDILKDMKQDVLLIDIASKPGGTDFAACEKFGLKAMLSLGLPGRYAPKASTEILLRSMRHLFSFQEQ